MSGSTILNTATTKISTIKNWLKVIGLPLGTTHFKSHLNEIPLEALRELVDNHPGKWVDYFKEGDNEISLSKMYCKTRLWGKKMGDDLEEETGWYLFSRGEGRPKQDRFIRRESPLRGTNILTISIIDGKLETIYAGPSLGAMPQAGKTDGDWENWQHHALAFTLKEIQEFQKED